MSATRLLVLGTVRLHGEAHGYQIRQTLLSWAADKWANVKPGSIYHALRKLAAEDLLVPVHTLESALGPDRTVYRITQQGEGEYFYLLQQAISDPDRGPGMFNAALPLITTLDRATAVFLLKARARAVAGSADTSKFLGETTIAAEPGAVGKPAHVAEMFRYWQVMAEAEAAWLDELVGKLEAGSYAFADEDAHAFGVPPR